MKRIKYLVLLITVFVINVMGVKAADFTSYVTGNSNIYAGESTTVTFGVRNSKEIYGLSTSVSYDSSKLEITSSKALSGFTLTLGSNAVLDSASGKSGSFTLFSITFKAKSGFVAGESTTVSFGNVESGDGDNLYKGSSASIKINMLAPKSSNNNFSYLKLDGKDLNLSKSSYSITVENSVESVTIEGDKEDPKASISGTGVKKLNLYSNKFSVVVTAENGSKRTYTITVVRKDAEGNTSKPKPVEEPSSNVPVVKEPVKANNIVIEDFPFDFDPSVFEYNVKVNSDTEKVNINVDKNDNYTINIENPEELVVGENLVTVTVTDKDGNSSTYKIIVFKPEKEAPTNTNCNNKDCKHTIYIIIIIIESIIILGLFGYLKKKEDFDKNKKDNSNKKKDESIVYIKE